MPPAPLAITPAPMTRRLAWLFASLVFFVASGALHTLAAVTYVQFSYEGPGDGAIPMAFLGVGILATIAGVYALRRWRLARTAASTT